MDNKFEGAGEAQSERDSVAAASGGKDTKPVEPPNTYLNDFYVIIRGGGKDIYGSRLQPQDMTPDSFARYQDLARQTGLDSTTPIYFSDDTPSPASVQLSNDPPNKPFILINTQEHQWSPDYARRFMMTQAQLQEMQKAGDLVRVSPSGISSDDFGDKKDFAQIYNLGLSPETYAAYRHLSEQLLPTKLPPELYVYTSFKGHFNGDKSLNNERMPQAVAVVTQEGTPAVVTNMASIDMSLFTPQKLVGVLAHELGHIKEGDATAAAFAYNHNHPGTQPYREERADLDAALAACQATGLSNALQTIAKAQLGLMAQADGDHKKTDAEYLALWSKSDTEHPPILLREIILDYIVQYPPEHCKKEEGQGR